MPTPPFVSITGKTQGNITQGAYTLESVGQGFIEGHEDEMIVQEVKHQVFVPTDPQNGQPSGQRQHKPLVLTIALNKAVPLLYNALAAGESLPEVALKWYRTSPDGKQEHYFTTKLEDATIVNMDLVMPNSQDPSQSHFTQLLDVHLAYRKIDWEHVVAGTSGADDWRKPAV
ncbi:Hcp family type VI secretion system effector [Budviciaceae bacterium CWB-B4]|uniref:Hcp family type VI secretion system effector n=2 Tax=Limnobaculum TaxID=2172100 RepID=A0A9D7AG63_9GAMM|nr:MULTISPECIES: Hcp family type VI secretion system effector [Limnobaculum]MBK5072172.1 Hcp family type VI secretion system effector [Limnobaculum xujianqingii]MBK5175481.1 Hcp family type VI secretion system effector [Limnobaculum xujianqingii]QBH97031.1 Hcp family type VI secretion system effector [Limnobaculum zhutongyuii]TQS87419.1 Hcp family type VI secretion system effector [Limnobaculum zhutongyuii]